MSFSVKLESRDWRPVTLLEKELQRYLTKNFPKCYLKRAVLQNLRRTSSVVEFVLDQIKEIESTPAAILKRDMHQGISCMFL